jgi:hypothetical protein
MWGASPQCRTGGQSPAPRRGGRDGGAGGCPAAILLAASWPPLAGAQEGGRQLPAPSSHYPATCPVPEAKREKAASQPGRTHNFAALGRARAGVQGSSYRRPELGEFISPPLCGGAEAAVARVAASRASGGSGRGADDRPRCPPGQGSLCRPPRPARQAPVLNGQLPAPRAAGALSAMASPVRGRTAAAR